MSTVETHCNASLRVNKTQIAASGDYNLTQKNMIDGPYAVYGGNGINGFHNEYFIKEPNIVIGRVGEYCGAVHITKPKSDG